MQDKMEAMLNEAIEKITEARDQFDERYIDSVEFNKQYNFWHGQCTVLRKLLGEAR